METSFKMGTEKQEKLDELLKEATRRPMTPEERERQRRSFVYGNTKLSNPEVTRKMVEEVGDALEEDND
jgi:hypothetical protein